MTRGVRLRGSCGAPSKIFSPWSSTTTRSTTRISTPMMCSTQTMVMPFSLRMLCSMSAACSISPWSRPLRLSSASSSLGWVASARASSSFLRAAAPRPSVVVRGIGRQADQASASSAWRQQRARDRSCRAARTRPTARRSRAASGSGTAAGSGRCGRCPCGRCGWPAGRRSPRPRTSPSRAVGAYMPAMQLKIVLLPEPFGPISPRISPSLTSKETFDTAVKPSNILVRPETVRRATRAARSAGETERGTACGPPMASSFSARRRDPRAAAAPGRRS